jgi:hypothetical protein
MTAALGTPRPITEERVHHPAPAGWRPSIRPAVPPSAPASPAAPPETTYRREPPRLHIKARHIADPQYYAPLLVASARALIAGATRSSAAPKLVVDLSAVRPGSYCAELVFLVGLLRRALGPIRLRLVGVTPAVAAPLIGDGLGADVVVVDTRGRTWPGEPDRVRPTGTCP